MTVADLPRLPEADIARIAKLAARLKNRDLPFETLLQNILSALGRFTISHNGIKAGHGLCLGPEAIKAFVQASEAVLVFFPKIMGKEMFLEIDGAGLFKIRLGLPPSISPAMREEAAKAPVFWLNLNLIPCLFQGLEYAYREEEEDLWILRRPDVLLNWMGTGWEGFCAGIEAVLPFYGLTTRETLENIQKPFTSLVEDVLARCGV